MSHVGDSYWEESTLFQIDSDANIARKRQHVSHVFEMCLKTFQKYHCVMQVDKNQRPLNCKQNDVHCRLKCVRCVSQSKQHMNDWNNTRYDANAVFSLSPLAIQIPGDTKIFSLSDMNAAVCVQCRENLCVSQQADSPVQTRNEIETAHGYRFETSVVNTELERNDLFQSEDDRRCHSVWVHWMISNSNALVMSLGSHSRVVDPTGWNAEWMVGESSGDIKILCWAALLQSWWSSNMDWNSDNIFITLVQKFA